MALVMAWIEMLELKNKTTKMWLLNNFQDKICTNIQEISLKLSLYYSSLCKESLYKNQNNFENKFGAWSFAINSLAISLIHYLFISFAINSLAICFTCSRPHLRSPHLLSSLTCYQVNLLSTYLLSKRLLSSLNCFQCSSAI